MERRFDLQAHRGGRGLRPENTVPAFETALDLLVTTLETDVHLTKDGVPVLFHDEALNERLVRVEGPADVPDPAKRPRISSLRLKQLLAYVADGNPDPKRFPDQRPDAASLARGFAIARDRHAFAIPTLRELFEFVNAYAETGKAAGKSDAQWRRAAEVRFNLELKRVPFRPEFIGDRFDGKSASDLERAVVQCVQEAGVTERTVIQSFDHRCVKAVRALEPKIAGAVLISNTAPVAPAALAQAAGATIYSPDFQFLDEGLVREVQGAGLRVIPWTVNEPADMERLLDWGVDGMITDYPDRLIPLLQRRHLRF
jgi:glycerophosphoryl diester phosphodiesterase